MKQLLTFEQFLQGSNKTNEEAIKAGEDSEVVIDDMIIHRPSPNKAISNISTGKNTSSKLGLTPYDFEVNQTK